MVLVVGASGLLGGRIAHLLLDAGRPVRAVSRDPARLRPLAERGAETVRADLTDPPSLARACEGVRQLITTANGFRGRGGARPPYVDGLGNRHLIDAARRAGVDHFVYVSAHVPEAYREIEFFRLKSETEAYLHASGVPHTILRPTVFMEVGAALPGDPLARNGTALIFGRGATPVNFVAVEDVARVAVEVLERPETLGQTFLVAGPDTLTPLGVVEVVERVTGRRGRRHHVPTFALAALAATFGSLNPVLARQLKTGLYADRYPQGIEVAPSPRAFATPSTTVEEWVQTRYLGRHASARRRMGVE